MSLPVLHHHVTQHHPYKLNVVWWHALKGFSLSSLRMASLSPHMLPGVWWPKMFIVYLQAPEDVKQRLRMSRSVWGCHAASEDVTQRLRMLTNLFFSWQQLPYISKRKLQSSPEGCWLRYESTKIPQEMVQSDRRKPLGDAQEQEWGSRQP